MAPISVIIPAHNEAEVLPRLLHELGPAARSGQLDIVVVANGCTDDTAEVARSFEPAVRVIETDDASKTRAFNLGDTAAHGFPRFYVDADIRLTAADIVRTADALGEPDIVAAAPKIEVDTTATSWAVRRYYDVWTQLPWVTDAMIGSGVFALSEAGRSRFDRFADVLADDYWVSAHFAPHERRSVDGARFVVAASPNLMALVRRKARILAYNRVLRDDLAGMPGAQPGGGAGLGSMARHPRQWVSLAVYLGIATASQLLARWKVLRRRLDWVGDR